MPIGPKPPRLSSTPRAFRLTEAFVAKIPAGPRDMESTPHRPVGRAARLGLRFHEGNYHHGNPYDPKIGDLRIRFEAALPGEPVTVIGRQAGDRILPFDNAGRERSLLASGLERGVNEMFDAPLWEEFQSIFIFMPIFWLGGYIGMMFFSYSLAKTPLLRDVEGLKILAGASLLTLGTSFLLPAFPWFSSGMRMIGVVMIAIALVCYGGFARLVQRWRRRAEPTLSA